MSTELLQSIIQKSNDIVFFGGAGVSTESGIPDYRSVDGLYHQKHRYPPETILSHDFFLSHPEDFYRFYRDKLIHLDAVPNPAHFTLAKLEQAGKLRAVITQNVDGLHQSAGSRTVYELHGSIHRNYCIECKQNYTLKDIAKGMGVPTCQCGGVIRPDVVLYGEALSPHVLQGAIEHLSQADTLIVGGTSLAVIPAASLIYYFQGKHLVFINKTPTPADSRADLVIHGNLGEVMRSLSI